MSKAFVVKHTKRTLVVTLVISAIIGAWVGYMRIFGNIHEVEPGLVYRSGQLWPSQLSALIKEKGIRTVVNLRGVNKGTAWYDSEIEVAQTTGTKHISLPMSARREPSNELLQSLIETLKTAQYPILIHCEAGADRSGLASALYQFVVKKKPVDQSAGQLSLRYGHFPWLLSRTGAMDRTFWRVVEQSAQQQSTAP